MVGRTASHAIGYALASYMGLAFFYSNDPPHSGVHLCIALIGAVMIGVASGSRVSKILLMHKESMRPEKLCISCCHQGRHKPRIFLSDSTMAKQAEIDREVTPGWFQASLTTISTDWNSLNPSKPSYRKRILLQPEWRSRTVRGKLFVPANMYRLTD